MLFENSPVPKQIKVGNDANNYGVETGINSGIIVVNQGPNYAETRAMCHEIVAAELMTYKAEALAEAQQRYNDLFELLVSKLNAKQMDDSQSLVAFKEPSMQYDYLEAQKAYIKAGTPELAAVLSDVLVKRIAESSRSLLQIVLGESIQVAPKLLKSQMATLALVFNITRTANRGVGSHEMFVAHLREYILPIFYDGVSRKNSEFEHLVFTGCTQYKAVRNSIGDSFKAGYPGLFMKGFDDSQIPRDRNGNSMLDMYPVFFTKGLFDNNKWQLNALDEQALSKEMSRINLPSDEQDKLISLFKKNTMSSQEIEDKLMLLIPEIKELIEYWKEEPISILSLTSVGLVIGAQYSHLINKKEYNLNTWI